MQEVDHSIMSSQNWRVDNIVSFSYLYPMECQVNTIKSFSAASRLRNLASHPPFSIEYKEPMKDNRESTGVYKTPTQQ